MEMKPGTLTITGELRIQFAEEKNKAGQRPMSVKFAAPGGHKLEVFGVRFAGDNVLPCMTATVRGAWIPHVAFSAELQMAIRDFRKAQAKEEELPGAMAT